MAHRKNDYRLTRAGKGVNINQKMDRVVATFVSICPNCQTKCVQEKIEKLAPGGKGKTAYQLHCTNCGFKRFNEFTNRSNYKSPAAKKGRAIQVFQEYLWDWLSEHIEEIIFLEMPEKINIFRGKMGAPRRHKGKPAYSSSELHPDFLKYLDTPEYIKILSTRFKQLEKDDITTFDFIVFRAWGYSFLQIDDIGHFAPYKLTTPRKKKLGRASYRNSDFCISLNRRATKFLTDSIPDNLLNTFGSDKQVNLAIEVANNDRRGARHERVTCPKCDGKNNHCTLCNGREHCTVPKWLADKYLIKIANGEWKE